MKNLTEDEFDARFTVIPDTRGDSVRPTFEGIPADSKHLWTILDAEGSLYAVTGLHRVNRIGYLLTEEAWDQEIEAVWYAPSDDDDDIEGEDPDNEGHRDHPPGQLLDSLLDDEETPGV
ncbi:hypothetical protein ACVWY0_001057 [Arthrobacter sp. UYNi723]